MNRVRKKFVNCSSKVKKMNKFFKFSIPILFSIGVALFFIEKEFFYSINIIINDAPERVWQCLEKDIFT